MTEVVIPEGQRCDLSVGVDYACSHPKIEMCSNHAVVFNEEMGLFGVFLCEEHKDWKGRE